MAWCETPFWCDVVREGLFSMSFLDSVASAFKLGTDSAQTEWRVTRFSLSRTHRLVWLAVEILRRELRAASNA